MRTIEVDTREVIPEKVFRVVGENQELCSTCQGLGLILQGEYILSCPDCSNGVTQKCEFCGEPLRPRYYAHMCEQRREQWREERRKKALDKWAATKKISLKEALANYEILYNDSNNEYVLADEFKDWLSDCLEDTEEMPLVYVTQTSNLKLDVCAILENESDNLYEEAISNISRDKIAELQNFLDQWCKDVANDTLTYWPDYDTAVMLEG